MSAADMQAVQVAIYDRLVAELATAGPGGTALPVYDHVPDDPSAAHVRLEGFGLLPEDTKNTHPARHRFTVRAFEADGSASSSTRGQMGAKGMQAAIIAALEDWRPVVGGSTVRHLGSTIPPGETASGFEASSRFEIII